MLIDVIFQLKINDNNKIIIIVIIINIYQLPFKDVRLKKTEFNIENGSKSI